MYLHRDGLQISISDSIALLQESVNDDIQNTIKLLSNKAGCFTDSYLITETIAPINSNAPKALAIRIGKIVFPSGEVFLGEDFLYQLPIYESESNQYLIATYQPLKDEKADYLCDSVEEYYFRRNGIKLELQNNFIQTNLNQAVLAKVTFFPGEILEINDWRQMFSPYHKTVMSEITASITEQYESDYLAFARLPFNIEGKLVSRYSLPTRLADMYKLRHEILNDATKIAQIDNTIINCVDADGFSLPVNLIPVEYLPAGVKVETYIKSLNPYDANDESEWLEMLPRTTGEDEEPAGVTPSISWCKNIPAFTYRLSTADGIDNQVYGQTWFAVDVGWYGLLADIDITKPPTSENKVVFQGGVGTPGESLFFPRESDGVKLGARAVGDGNVTGVITGINETSTVFTEPILMKIPFRGHGTIDDDYAAQRWYSCTDGSVPVFQLHNPSEKGMYITRVDVINYGTGTGESTLYIGDEEICSVDEAAVASPIVPFTDSATEIEIFITGLGGRDSYKIFYIKSDDSYINFDGELTLHVCYYR